VVTLPSPSSGMAERYRVPQSYTPFLVLSISSTCYFQRLPQRARSAGALVSSSIQDLRPWRVAR
jgi:hypothetical protein